MKAGSQLTPGISLLFPIGLDLVPPGPSSFGVLLGSKPAHVHRHTAQRTSGFRSYPRDHMGLWSREKPLYLPVVVIAAFYIDQGALTLAPIYYTPLCIYTGDTGNRTPAARLLSVSAN